MFMELSGYVGWNLFWVVAILVKNQGINILLNVFFGPLINSAQAISRQISHAVISFTQNFTIAFNPQIVKSYASGNISEMLILIFRTTKISFFLIILFLVPLQLELTFVLELWLKQIPEYVTIFTRIFLIEALIESLCYPLTAGSRATGKIALYQTISSGLMVLSLPIAFIFLKNNFPVVGVQMIVLILFLFIYIVRIFMLSNQLKFSIRQYLLYAITPSIFTLIAGSIMPVLFVTLHKEGFIRLLLTTIISTISIMICAFFIGLSKNEKVVVVKIVKKALLKDGTV
ncbi:hypothetical protein AGMMS49928_27600 [Spirochaetia bacterium]|nr:hypothetical protein AGMMS49928_27600 [Spirochaetia bacterium]